VEKVTMAKSQFMVLESMHAFVGSRFEVRAGERRVLRYGYEDPMAVPRLVAQVRSGQAIDWGGAALMPSSYRVLYDGPGPLPPAFRD
jgi:hypothetical protein